MPKTLQDLGNISVMRSGCVASAACKMRSKFDAKNLEQSSKISPQSIKNQPKTNHACKSAFDFVFRSMCHNFSFQRSNTRTLKIIKNLLVFFNVLACSALYKLCYIHVQFVSHLGLILVSKIDKYRIKNH